MENPLTHTPLTDNCFTPNTSTFSTLKQEPQTTQPHEKPVATRRRARCGKTARSVMNNLYHHATTRFALA